MSDFISQSILGGCFRFYWVSWEHAGSQILQDVHNESHVNQLCFLVWWLYVTVCVRDCFCPMSMNVSETLISGCYHLKRREFHRLSANVWISLAPQISFPVFPHRSFSLYISVTVSLCFMLLLFPAAHTHTHSDTHTLLRLSCGNRPCPCKSWLRVINQASQPSSTFVWFD